MSVDPVSLTAAINAAARDLPDGWLIQLCVERGAGWIELHNPDGDRHELEDMADLTLGEQVAVAISEARRATGDFRSSAQQSSESRDDIVAIPKNEAQAELMAKMGISWLEANAPHRLKSSATVVALRLFVELIERRRDDLGGLSPEMTECLRQARVALGLPEKEQTNG